MADPVVMDDGGSTRIKLISVASSSIDSLVDVALNTSTHQFESQATATGPYTQLTIVYLDAAGTATNPPGSPFPLAAGTSIVLTSANQQRVRVRIVNNAGTPGGSAADCEITVFAIGGVIPYVESRSADGKRRYVITNSGAISNVNLNPGPSMNTPSTTVYATVNIS